MRKPTREDGWNNVYVYATRSPETPGYDFSPCARRERSVMSGIGVLKTCKKQNIITYAKNSGLPLISQFSQFLMSCMYRQHVFIHIIPIRLFQRCRATQTMLRSQNTIFNESQYREQQAHLQVQLQVPMRMQHRHASQYSKRRDPSAPATTGLPSACCREQSASRSDRSSSPRPSSPSHPTLSSTPHAQPASWTQVPSRCCGDGLPVISSTSYKRTPLVQHIQTYTTEFG